MKEELKNQIEEAATTVRGDGQMFINADFESGAEWLFNHGYRFTTADMHAFAKWYRVRARSQWISEKDALKLWLKERG